MIMIALFDLQPFETKREVDKRHLFKLKILASVRCTDTAPSQHDKPRFR